MMPSLREEAGQASRSSASGGRAHSSVTVMQLLEAAAREPSTLSALAADPIGAALGAGLRLTLGDLKRALGIPFATDRELVALLQARLQRCAQGASCGCGG